MRTRRSPSASVPIRYSVDPRDTPCWTRPGIRVQPSALEGVSLAARATDLEAPGRSATVTAAPVSGRASVSVTPAQAEPRCGLDDGAGRPGVVVDDPRINEVDDPMNPATNRFVGRWYSSSDSSCWMRPRS